jgi:hypothetical protein
MRQANAHMVALAEQLAAYEFVANGASAKVSSPGSIVCEKLRTQLSMLMGNAGFGALFARAIALTKAEFPSMSELEINPSGMIVDLDPVELKANLPELSRVSVRVLAELLGLLVAFIGEPLVLGLVQEIWPKFALRGSDNVGRKNGKTK